MFCMLKKKSIHPANISKHNSDCKKQIILLVIPNGEGWHYLAVKKLPALLRGNTSKHHDHFYCLNCLHSFTTVNFATVNFMKKDLCNIIMPSEDTKLLKFNQYRKSDKARFIIYVDVECLIEKN